MLLKGLLVLGVLAAAVATPAVVRTREEIEAFRRFLERTKTSDGTQYLVQLQSSPLVNPEETSGNFEGDIVLDEFLIEDILKAYAMGRNAYTWPDRRWPDNTIVWEFGEGEFDSDQKAAIEEGIKAIEENTCIKFRYREPEDTNFVRLTGLAGGCYANVGYRETRGVHTLNLARNVPGKGCFRHGTIVHEWLHIIGFFHMQSTYNRDQYVKIVTENLRPGTEHNFAIYTPDEVTNLGVEYDYVSCLHYGPTAFSVSGEATIVALKEHEGTMGQRIFITDKDWLRANRQYECPGAWD